MAKKSTFCNNQLLWISDLPKPHTTSGGSHPACSSALTTSSARGVGWGFKWKLPYKREVCKMFSRFHAWDMLVPWNVIIIYSREMRHHDIVPGFSRNTSSLHKMTPSKLKTLFVSVFDELKHVQVLALSLATSYVPSFPLQVFPCVCQAAMSPVQHPTPRRLFGGFWNSPMFFFVCVKDFDNRMYECLWYSLIYNIYIYLVNTWSFKRSPLTQLIFPIVADIHGSVILSTQAIESLGIWR